MERLHAKIIAGVVMLVAIFICFVLPIKMSVFFKKKGDKGKYYLDLLACFAGGVFLAVYLIFMAPAVRDLILENLMIPNQITYPIPDVLIGAGFFLMLILNRIVVSLCHTFQSKKTSAPQLTSISSRNSEKMTTELCQNGIKTSSVDVIVDNTALDNIEKIDPNNPYPLARRSSIEDVAQQESVARGIVMMLALSFDSLFEGLTTGLKTTTVEVWAIFVGNLVHEAIIAFCLGLQLIKANGNKRLPVILAAVAYSLMNPIGLTVATIFYEWKNTGAELDLVSGLIQGITSGCFIYVTFCEILEGQLTHQTPYSKIISMVLGFIFLAAFSGIPGGSSYALVDRVSNCTLPPIAHE